ncbi:PqqD family protein [Clostridium felsineum]|uniref:Uncharacterized protein n=1 Tax=Clostridium felsineum TaxID=36839 RepID=A0A1S8LSA5_9CLOT|nr:PqqD family protein [Clostridium felsineum]URZ08014.1 hypothetical protein CLROS_033800 [Clostridium felsineum]URZ13045.1 hypothetical protein CROST_037950 [Clostridium felsineum]
MSTILMKNKNIFFREELNGQALVYSKFLSEEFLNETSSLIYKSINGKNSYDDIVEIVKNEYKDVDVNEIEKDVYDCLYMFKNLRLINWEGKLDEKMEATTQGYQFKAAGEREYKNISLFIKEKYKQQGDKVISFIPYDDMRYYNDFQVRTRNFNFSELHFISERNDDITSLISVLNFKPNDSTVSLGLIIADKECMDDLESNYKSVEQILKDNGKRKIKINIVEDRMKKPLLDFIEKIGFEKEAVLEKEYNGVDIHSFRKFL